MTNDTLTSENELVGSLLPCSIAHAAAAFRVSARFAHAPRWASRASTRTRTTDAIRLPTRRAITSVGASAAFFFSCFLLATSCTSPGAYQAASRNAAAIKSVDLNMTKAEVIGRMGQPVAREAILDDDGSQLELLRWLTDYRDHIYTIVTFRDGRAISIVEAEGSAP